MKFWRSEYLRHVRNALAVVESNECLTDELADAIIADLRIAISVVEDEVCGLFVDSTDVEEAAMI